jgi:predicted ATPase
MTPKKVKNNKLVFFLTGIIMILGLCIVFLNDDLQYQRKASLDSAQYCIKYTADIMVKGSTDLVHERAAHEYDLAKANSNIEGLVSQYNTLAKKLRLPILSIYPYMVYKS